MIVFYQKVQIEIGNNHNFLNNNNNYNNKINKYLINKILAIHSCHNKIQIKINQIVFQIFKNHFINKHHNKDNSNHLQFSKFRSSNNHLNNNFSNNPRI